jgi:hypothetical protein
VPQRKLSPLPRRRSRRLFGQVKAPPEKPQPVKSQPPPGATKPQILTPPPSRKRRTKNAASPPKRARKDSLIAPAVPTIVTVHAMPATPATPAARAPLSLPVPPAAPGRVDAADAEWYEELLMHMLAEHAKRHGDDAGAEENDNAAAAAAVALMLAVPQPPPPPDAAGAAGAPYSFARPLPTTHPARAFPAPHPCLPPLTHPHGDVRGGPNPNAETDLRAVAFDVVDARGIRSRAELARFVGGEIDEQVELLLRYARDAARARAENERVRDEMRELDEEERRLKGVLALWRAKRERKG